MEKGISEDRESVHRRKQANGEKHAPNPVQIGKQIRQAEVLLGDQVQSKKGKRHHQQNQVFHFQSTRKELLESASKGKSGRDSQEHDEEKKEEQRPRIQDKWLRLQAPKEKLENEKKTKHASLPNDQRRKKGHSELRDVSLLAISDGLGHFNRHFGALQRSDDSGGHWAWSC